MGKIKQITAKETRELISFVKLNPALWKKNSPGYNNTKEKLQAWTAIGRNMKTCQMPAQDAKTRFKSLRDRFGKELKREKKSQPSTSGAGHPAIGTIYVSDWEFYGDLQFLKDQMSPKSTKSNMEIDKVLDPPGEEEKSEDENKKGEDETHGDLPSWFTMPKVDPLTKKAKSEEVKENLTQDIEETDEERLSSESSDSNSESEISSNKPPKPKKIEIQRKVPESDAFAKPHIRISEDVLTQQLGEMARMTSRAMKKLSSSQTQPRETTSSEISPESNLDPFDIKIQPMIEMLKCSLKPVPDHLLLECTVGMIQVAIQFSKKDD